MSRVAPEHADLFHNVAPAAAIAVSPVDRNDKILQNVPTPLDQPNMRRQSTASRFKNFGEIAKGLAFSFRPFPSPRTPHSVLASLVVCTLLQLIVGAPYAVNEMAAEASPATRVAMRGLIVGVLMLFANGPIFLVNLPTIGRGGFHVRYLLVVPLNLGVGIGVAFIPVDGSTLGFMSIALLIYTLTYLLGGAVLHAPLLATDEHKALHKSVGPPTLVAGLLFFGVVVAYIELTRLFSSPLVGLLLPMGSSCARITAFCVLAHSFNKRYYEPKAKFLAQLADTRAKFLAQTQRAMMVGYLRSLATLKRCTGFTLRSLR
jgi:hypothetical protein